MAKGNKGAKQRVMSVPLVKKAAKSGGKKR